MTRQAVNLRIESRVIPPSQNSSLVALPVALSSHPSLSWVVALDRNGQSQSGYQIAANVEDGATWDSQLVTSSENYRVTWAGSPLAVGDIVNWKVRTRDDLQQLSLWSETAEFVVPPLRSSDWKGEWITVPTTHAACLHFAVDRPVRRILIHFAAQGFVRGCLDGQWINADARDPTDAARTRAASRSYDATICFDASRSTHILAFVCGVGHHRKVLDDVRLLLDMTLYFADGSRQTLGTSERWKTAPTSLTTEDPFYIERHDERQTNPWLLEATNSFPKAKLAESTAYPLPIRIQPDAGPPLEVIGELNGALLNEGEDFAVYDFGENVAARSFITLHGTRSGQEVTVIHAEMLKDNGRVDTSNLRFEWDREKERQGISWVCADKNCTIYPWFAIHGFRYLEIRSLGEARVVDVKARVIHSDVQVVGHFSSSDALLDRLVATAQRTQLNNLHGHPEDCPTREQSGWTGDASVSAEAALYHLDMMGLYHNWLRDVTEDQRLDGGILGISPRLVPDVAVQPPDPVWGSAMTEIPLRMFWNTGNVHEVEPFFPAMRLWCDWQLQTLEDGVVSRADISFGADWLALVQTPPVMLQTTAVIRSLDALLQLESASGNVEEAQKRLRQKRDLVASAREALWDSVEGVWANGTQASYGVALSSGLVEDKEQELVRMRLARAISDAHGKLSSGYSGTQSVLRAMGDFDDGQLLCDMVHDTSKVGIGAMLSTPPGTFWETWYLREPVIGSIIIGPHRACRSVRCLGVVSGGRDQATRARLPQVPD